MHQRTICLVVIYLLLTGLNLFAFTSEEPFMLVSSSTGGEHQTIGDGKSVQMDATSMGNKALQYPLQMSEEIDRYIDRVQVRSLETDSNQAIVDRNNSNNNFRRPKQQPKPFKTPADSVRVLINMCFSVEDHSLVKRQLMRRSNDATSPNSSPESTAPIHAYYVNLDRDKARRNHTETVLNSFGTPFTRIRAHHTSEIQKAKVTLRENPQFPPVSDAEIACTVSHFLAIHEAVHDPYTKDSPYSLIMEDDLTFRMKVDFNALVQSAPPDFAVLQLATSNVDELKAMWSSFVSEGDGRTVWQERKWQQLLWSTQAYIINKDVVRPHIDAMVQLLGTSEELEGVSRAGLASKARIARISNMGCPEKKAREFLPFRLVADQVIYTAFGPTYVLRVPFVNSAGVGAASSIRAGL